MIKYYQIFVPFLFCVFFSGNLRSATITWTGSTDTDWHKKCNWNSNTIPTCTDDVIIPNVANDPVIAGVAHCNTIDIQSSSGALLTIQSSTGGLLEIGTCPTAKTDNGGCTTDYYVFVSTNEYSGTTSVATRDNECANNASAAGLSGTFKAWISTGVANNISSTTSIRYILPGGTQVADDWTDLTNGNIDNPINKYANGGNAGSQNVWTGLTSAGNATSDCSNWGNWASTGVYGNTGVSASGGWTNTSSTTCRTQSIATCQGTLVENCPGPGWPADSKCNDCWPGTVAHWNQGPSEFCGGGTKLANDSGCDVPLCGLSGRKCVTYSYSDLNMRHYCFQTAL